LKTIVDIGYITYNGGGIVFLVEYYQEENGTYPAEEFICSLDKKMRARIGMIICLLESYGNEVREPYSRHLVDGIFEIRAVQSSNIVRVLYFFYHGKRIVLTNGFVKKTQKTPAKEIALALKRKQTYSSRGGR
jgi:phage-related protein